MEEEIIIPEEETFEYNKLRYILDENGYVCHASLGGLIVCDLGECTEYTGEIPKMVDDNKKQYASIEEWCDIEISKDRLNAWKIVDGNLVYDGNKYNELKKIYEEQAEKNAPATHEYVDSRINGIKIENKDLKALFDKSSYEGFEVALLNDASDFEIDKLVIHTTMNEKKINLVFSTSNMLYHELVAIKKEGITFTVNEDKSIKIKGTSKSPFEINILGDSENTNPFFVFKKNVEYTLSGLDGVVLNMYNFDGETQTQVYSGTGGSILFTDETKSVTNVTLSIDGEYNTTLFPMLNLGETEIEYEEGKYELVTIDLPEYECLYPSDELFPSEDVYPCFWGDVTIRIEGGKVYITDESEREPFDLLTPKTHSTKTTVYTFEDSTLDLNYITCYSNGVPYDEVIKSINNSPEKITIEANKIDVKGVLSVLGESGSTVINGNNITTGKIKADRLDTSKINATQGSVGGWTINSSKLGGDNTYLNPNGSCQFYPSGGSIVAWNNAIRLKGPSGIGIYNTHTNYGSSTSINNGINIMADAGNLNLMNESSSYGVNVRAYCSSNSIGDAGARSIRLAAGANIAMYAVGGYCYAEGNGVSSAKIKTDSGSASSKNVKTNIEEFSEDEYNSSLDLLNKMKIYNYDYKYDLYKDKEQYGFILDEIEELDNKFFKITEEEAIVEGEHLDFNLDNKKDTDNTINVKKYDSDALDKYLLTVCKALLNKVNTLENKIKEMESDK